MASTKKTAMENFEEPVRDGYATVRDACEFLSLSRASIYNLMDARELKYAKFGGSRRIPWSALVEYGERCTVGGNG